MFGETLENIIKSRLFDYIIALGAGYFFLIIRGISKDISAIAQGLRDLKEDNDKVIKELYDSRNETLIRLTKLEQKVCDHVTSCLRRHKK